MRKRNAALVLASVIIIGFIAIYGIQVKKSNDNNVKNSAPEMEYGAEDELRFADGIYIEDSSFISQIEDVYENLQSYKGKIMHIEGLVRNINGNEFDVVRLHDVNCDDHSHRIMVGITASYDGHIPEKDSWVKISGTIEIRTSNGKDEPLLKVEELEVKEEKGQEVVYSSAKTYVDEGH